MLFHKIITLAFFTLAGFTTATAAQQSCPTGEGRLRDGEPCIPSYLLNYLYCLQQSGGGKIEVVKKDDVTKTGTLEVTVGGKGSGVVIKGEGSSNVKQSEASRAVKELREKLDPSLTKNCKDITAPLKKTSTTMAPVATGDKVIDKVQKNLASLGVARGGVPESQIAETLAPLFSRPAFYSIREGDWRYFLFALCKTRLILEENIQHFKANPKTRKELGDVVQLMVQLQNDVALLYGTNFSVPDHIRRYINNRDAFTKNLPPLLREPDDTFFDARDVTIGQIREKLKPLGLSSF